MKLSEMTHDELLAKKSKIDTLLNNPVLTDTEKEIIGVVMRSFMESAGKTDELSDLIDAGYESEIGVLSVIYKKLRAIGALR